MKIPCPRCHGKGEIVVTSTSKEPEKKPCHKCGGNGWVVEKEKKEGL